MLPTYQMFMNVPLFEKGGEPVRTKAGDIEVKVWDPGRKVLGDIFEFVAERENEATTLIDISDPEDGYLVRSSARTDGDTGVEDRLVSPSF